MFLRYDPDAWHSDQHTTWRQTGKLTPGQIVIADRRPFRIDRVRELPTGQWPDKFVQAWRDAGMPDTATWPNRPMQVTGFWEGPGADSRGYGVAARACHLWSVLPEHYAVCHKCLELPPCRHVHTEEVMERAAERMNQDMAILPGACHACREPISRRQKSFTFPGPNLIRPDFGDDSAVFHTRAKCLGSLRTYDERWAKAGPGRERLFFCEGTQTTHHNGTTECDNPQCVAKGAHADLVNHRCRIRHYPYRDMRGVTWAACWCLAGHAETAASETA